MKPPDTRRSKTTKLHRAPSTSSWSCLLLLPFPFFLSLYLLLFSSSLPSPPLLHPFQHTSHKALIEPPTTHQPISLRIYVYHLPPPFNTHWLSNPRCASHLFASEVALHRAILSSPFHTSDPRLAHLFFVPVYLSCNFSTPTGFPSLAHAPSLLSSAVAHISSHFPFWNRSSGADHVFVASHDHGACFHAIESAAVAAGIPTFLRRSILLQTFGVRRPHPCQDVAHVVIPPYIPPDDLPVFSPEASKRDIFAFFRGKMELHPKNVSGHFYGKGLRTEIWRRFAGDRSFYLKRKKHDGYRAEMARSVFCLCPAGWAPWSPRFVEAAALGCVPVIIADGIRLPFPDAVPWPEISISVPEMEVGKLGRILGHVAATNLTKIQANLWRPEVRRALLYNRQIQEGDATWQVMRALSRMVGRPRRRGVIA